MLFNSLSFLFFFVIVCLLYYNLPHQRRWILLLAASYFFYMCWKPVYILLIMVSTAIDYLAARTMNSTPEIKKRRKYLILSIFTNLGLLFSFKYLNFFNDSITALMGLFHYQWTFAGLDVLLPVGISFYTFQTMSYTIDVYYGRQKAEHHAGLFALYVSFFPQLVAGPIERPGNLLPQLKSEVKLDYGNISAGLKIMLWGFFKKIVIADNLSFYVNEVYNNPAEQSGLRLALATVFFAFQIYCDFSGYTDIAIGVARVLGINLMKNFRTPYYSKSIPEFWQRWHISLSTWFRDYLYIPLGGSRVKIGRFYLNIILVFTISGLWHGANWTFIIWGALHGLYYLVDFISKKPREKLFKTLQISGTKAFSLLSVLLTFAMVCFSWIFFRANNLGDALVIIEKVFTDFSTNALFDSAFQVNILFGVVGLIWMEILELWMKGRQFDELLAGRPVALRWAVYYLVFGMLVFAGYFGKVEFIYFQF